MLTFSGLIKWVGVAMCISIAAPVFAESAPVYDADTLQQESTASDQADNLPPPPPPQQETFIPVQPSIQPNVSSAQPSQPLSIYQRMQRIEQQVSNMQNSDAATRVDSLQDQMQALRGQIEQLTHQLEQLQSQQKTMYSDLDGRLAQSGTTAATTTKDTESPRPVEAQANPATNTLDATELPVETPTVNKSAKPIVIKTSKKQTISSESKQSGQPDVAEEQQIYQTAYNLIKAKKYTEAVTILQGMLKKYPSGQFASNAHYWLGELYGLMGKNELALSEFKLVVDMYPDSPRVSDAQLKVGLLLASELRWPEAKSALKRVINRYPGSASARLAAEQLKQIKIAGH